MLYYKTLICVETQTPPSTALLTEHCLTQPYIAHLILLLLSLMSIPLLFFLQPPKQLPFHLPIHPLHSFSILRIYLPLC